MIPAAHRKKIIHELGREALRKATVAKAARTVEIGGDLSQEGGPGMAVVQIVESPGGTKEQFEQVIHEIGLTGSHLAPGHVIHFAGPVGDG